MVTYNISLKSMHNSKDSLWGGLKYSFANSDIATTERMPLEKYKGQSKDKVLLEFMPLIKKNKTFHPFIYKILSPFSIIQWTLKFPALVRNQCGSVFGVKPSPRAGQGWGRQEEVCPQGLSLMLRSP